MAIKVASTKTRSAGRPPQMAERQFIYVNAPFPLRAPRGSTLTRPTEATDAELRRLMATEPLPVPAVTGRTTAERILGMLLDDQLRLGPREFIEVDRDMWLAKIDAFVSRNQAIRFVLMCCPYKKASPVKTDRVRADMGELLMFRRLGHLAALIRAVYEPGAEMTLLVEGILGRYSEDQARVRDYERSLPGLLSILGQDAQALRLFDLGQISTQVPHFDQKWDERAEEISRRLAAGDPATKLAAASVIPATRSSVPVLEYPAELVLRAYAEGAASQSQDVRLLADRIDAQATVEFCRYLAFLQLRDESGFLEEVAPGALKLTVSAKRGNIGSLAINRRTHILPYHGVPVRLPSGRWSIRYLISVRSSRHRYQPVLWAGDPDRAPVAYLATES